MIKVLPDLLVDNNGTECNAGDWNNRRKELYAAIIEHEYGGMPPAPETVEVFRKSITAIRPERKVKYVGFEIRSVFEKGELPFPLSMWIPPGDGPFPVVLDGDGCWRCFNDDIAKAITQRGYIAASFNRTDMAADNNDQYRQTGLYRILPDARFGAIAAWAWGYHRAVDFLTGLDFVIPGQIAITGHSRGGKTVLLAGATDERIAVTNPNCSGTGGSGLNRLKAEGAERIADFKRNKVMFWFGPGFAEYAGRDSELPYDQHFLHALVAPRGLLITEAKEDAWSNPPGSYAAVRAAEKVYDLLGETDKIGWVVRDGGHLHSPDDFTVLLDFIDGQFKGIPVKRSFKDDCYTDLEKILK